MSKSDAHKMMTLAHDEEEALKAMHTSDQNYEEHSNLFQTIDAEKNIKIREKLLKKSIKLEKKAVKSRIFALKRYHEIYVQRYKLYRSDLKKFFNTAPKEKVDSASILENLAYAAFETAELELQKGYYTFSQSELFNAFTKAFQSEQLGLLYQEKIYSIFLDWDETAKNKLEKEIESILQNKPIELADSENLNELRKDSIAIKTIYIYDTVKIEKNVDEVIYKVQIAASKKQLSINQLKKIYPAYNLIQTEIENEWYKYSVGYFKYYKDAQRFKMNTGIPDAFIVVYKNGIKVQITEVLMHPSFLGQ